MKFFKVNSLIKFFPPHDICRSSFQSVCYGLDFGLC
nr:MAG TPA: hypothetical protein [Caudoviricetes sp.]